MISAKKQFGQNFLKNEIIIDKIIESIPNNQNNIVEIGPGLGDLTKKLLGFGTLTSYEIDRDLYDILKVEFAKELKSGNFHLILGDALDIWSIDKLCNKRYFLVANLPYYVATKMILKAINSCRELELMFGKLLL